MWECPFAATLWDVLLRAYARATHDNPISWDRIDRTSPHDWLAKCKVAALTGIDDDGVLGGKPVTLKHLIATTQRHLLQRRNNINTAATDGVFEPREAWSLEDVYSKILDDFEMSASRVYRKAVEDENWLQIRYPEWDLSEEGPIAKYYETWIEPGVF